jgi:predicted  nucleic acid-binding Zn-ribbon protein
MATLHPIHRRYYAEDLVRLRRAGEGRRYAASQRRGRIDPNPHQVEAVMFALRRIPEGGCILADEVGLGKTIEAGLVIAQLLAEGASRILIVVPLSLLGQWQSELYTLFGIEASEAGDDGVDASSPGVFLAGREYAGGKAGFEKLNGSPPFDLFVVDEAHEVFAGIHKRFDRYGVYDEASRYAQTAHRVRKLIGASPVLLLTATPIQNSLAELWGLIQYIEPTGTLLGLLPTFVSLFCADGDTRRLVVDQSEELRRRLGSVVKRTLRRQAQEFMERPFVGRRAQLFEYSMSPEERSLYQDVTDYLLQPSLCAFQGRSRQLLLLGFHRRMASSTAALAQSLEKVAERLRRILDGLGAAQLPDTATAFLSDLEDDSTAAQTDRPDTSRADEASDEPAAPAPNAIRAELARVEDFIRRARSLPHDSKAESLVKAVQLTTRRPGSRQKVVIFTESLTTQEYNRDLLLENASLSGSDITLFRGVNSSPRATEALQRWNREVAPQIASHAQPSPAVAIRLALVHEFKTRSKVLISTEAGAKGLNLQFCDTIINYDLPWNPQRIEQRIGRCHRYGQERDVTVINFLARDNEAQRLTLEILSSKLDLFGEVLDMSDVVLHTPRSDRSEEFATALGPDFEAQLRRIWERARSVEEVEEELRQLRDSIEDRRHQLEQVRERTIGLIESRLDDSVRQVFRQIHEELPATLAELDAELERVLVGYFEAADIPYELGETGVRRSISVPASSRLPEPLSSGVAVALGAAHDLEEVESLHAAHPLIEAAVAEARASGAGHFSLRFRLSEDAPEVLKLRRCSRGRLALTRIEHRGFEREDRLKVTAVFENAEVLRPAEAAHELLQQPCEDAGAFDPPLALTPADLTEVVNEEIFLDHSLVAKSEQESFEKAIDQLDQYMEDRILILRRARLERAEHLLSAEKKRDRSLGPDARTRAEAALQRLSAEVEELDQQIARLTARVDDEYNRWKQHAHSRRYESPRAERLLEAEFVLE